MRFKYTRSNKKGASMITLITCIAFFIVLPLSLVGFEMGRYYLLITQVTNIAGACALSGTGAIATIPSTASAGPGLQALYNGCSQEAIYCLQLNSILGHSMVNALPTGNVYNNVYAPYVAPPTPAVDKAAISVSFLNQDGSWHQDLTTSGATRMAVTISYTTRPIFSTPGIIVALMPTETATASSTGGLPQLDVFLCFDMSGSMDDQTGVCYVNRYWDPVNNHVAYDFNANLSGGPGTIYNQTPGIQITGTQVNAVPPQNLVSRSGSLYFNQLLRCDTTASNEAGQLPGGVSYVSGVATPHAISYPNGTQNALSAPGVANPAWKDPYTGYPSFTDLVVVPSTAAPTAAYVAPPGWQTIAVRYCEQSRGNLTNLATLQASQGGVAALALNPYVVALTADATAGKTAQQYWAFAAANATPSFQALQAAQNFVSTMNLSTDARFGLGTFAGNASSPSVNTLPATANTPPQYLISNGRNTTPAYTQGGAPANGSYPLPFVSMSAGTPGSYNQAYNALKPPDGSYNPAAANLQLVPMTETDMYNALNNGITDVINNGRATARKAIVLFTDGIPTYDAANPAASIPNNDDASIIGLASTYCQPRNIPVYTIGLAQGANAALMTKEAALLGSLSAAGGQGGQYFPTTSASDLNAAFQAIARSLVLLRSAG